MSILRIGGVLSLLVLMLLGCKHKELCYEHPHSKVVEVRFHWKEDVQIAKAMRVLCYPIGKEKAEPYGFDIGNSQGGIINLPAGKYKVLAYNLDTENVVVEGDQQLSLLHAYTNELVWARSRRSGRSGSALHTVDAPDYMTRAYEDQVEVISSLEHQYIDLYPEEAVCRFTLEVHGIKGLPFVRQSRVSLSHIAPTLFLHEMRLEGKSSEALFETKIEGNVLTGAFNIFGLLPLDDNTPRYELTLFFRTEEKNIYVTYDVSEQILAVKPKQGHIRHVHLILKVDVEIAKPIGNGGGFRPDVDDWQPIEREIEI